MPDRKWTKKAIEDLYEQPFPILLYKAHSIHKENFKAEEIELCTLLSIKTGSCPEDCAYCPQSAHYKTNIQKESLLSIENVLQKAELAKRNGSSRFCIAAGWRNPPNKEFRKVLEMVRKIKAIGLESCATLGMLSKEQATELRSAGLNFYNHNLDTSPEYYKEIITTRTYQERLDTLKNVRDAGINVCCGGIIGMGETREDRIALLNELVNLPKPPESVPINRLIPIEGTPLDKSLKIDNFEFIRTIAVARIIMPTSVVRLTAGRDSMSEEMQALCFFAGANSIFSCDKLLTTPHTDVYQDKHMLDKLGFKAKKNKTC